VQGPRRTVDEGNDRTGEGELTTGAWRRAVGIGVTMSFDEEGRGPYRVWTPKLGWITYEEWVQLIMELGTDIQFNDAVSSVDVRVPAPPSEE